MASLDSFGALTRLRVGGRDYSYYRLGAVAGLERLPYSLKILAENLLRHQDGQSITPDQVRALAQWDPAAAPAQEIQFTPARVVMQDFTGVPCVVDVATMRQAVAGLGGDPLRVNPLAPAELVIDHSVIVDQAGSAGAFEANVELEFSRNAERYQFLRWGQRALENFAVVPPDTGIVHQVNVEYLARGVMTGPGGLGEGELAFPDTCVGTDSHTTMVNGLGVLGWGVGGIEAEAAMLGQPVSMLIPRVVGFRLSGAVGAGVTATDVVLTITARLRELGVVGSFVEFYGTGLAALSVATRSTISNMSPEFGSTCAIFPVDRATLDFLGLTGRPADQLALIEAYATAQGLWHDPLAPGYVEPVYSQTLELDLATVTASIAGPKRPQDRIDLTEAAARFKADLPGFVPPGASGQADGVPVRLADGRSFNLSHGAVVIAAITSCTNTSNPSVMLAAGLLARKAVERGLSAKPWVKTSLAPGSRVVTDYLARAGLTDPLERLGFHVVAYGCTTCIGNSGPLAPEISAAITSGGLAATAVLSGNRNFEGRINPDVAMNYLASPPLVVAYAIAGNLNVDLTKAPLGIGRDGQEVFLDQIWPSDSEIAAAARQAIGPEAYAEVYADVFAGSARWQALDVPDGATFAWEEASTYIRQAPYFDGMSAQPAALTGVQGARVLALLGDSVTTDHISPAGSIRADSPAGAYLMAHGVEPTDFNSYGSRRGNHEVMVRGTFANVRLRNRLVDRPGGWTHNFCSGQVETIYDAAMAYRAAGLPLVIIAGTEYGSGSSRDWAAKGTALLGVRAVLAQSFERIHRSNLIGMGLLPLQFPPGMSAQSLGLTGHEVIDIDGIEAMTDGPVPPDLEVTATKPDGTSVTFHAIVRIDTPGEATYYRHGGILPYMVRRLAGLIED